MLRQTACAALLVLFAAGLLGGCSGDPTSAGLPQIDSLRVAVQLPEGAASQQWYLEQRVTYVRDNRTGSTDVILHRRTVGGSTATRTDFRVPVPRHTRVSLSLWFLDDGERTVTMTREHPDGSFESLEPSVDDGVEYRVRLNPRADWIRPLPRLDGRKLRVIMEEPGSCSGESNWTLQAFTWAAPEVPVGGLRFREEFVYQLTRPVDVPEIAVEIPRLRYVKLLHPQDGVHRILVDGVRVPQESCYPGDVECRNLCTVTVPQ